MNYLLDTNACIRYLNGKSAPLADRLRGTDPSDVRICSVTKAELLYGARHGRRQAENLRMLEVFFAGIPSLPFDDACAERYGVVRADLASRGQPIGEGDLLIASITLAHGLTLVTHNTREFSRVAGLRLEDWEA